MWDHCRLFALEDGTKKVLCLACLMSHTRVEDAVKLSYHNTSNAIKHLKKHGITEATTKATRQEKLELAMSKLRKVATDAPTMLVYHCAKVCIKDLRPFSFVEGEGFKELIGFLSPAIKARSRCVGVQASDNCPASRAQVPSRKQVKEMCEAIYAAATLMVRRTCSAAVVSAATIHVCFPSCRTT